MPLKDCFDCCECPTSCEGECAWVFNCEEADPYTDPPADCHWELETDCGESNDSGCQCANKKCDWEWETDELECNGMCEYDQRYLGGTGGQVIAGCYGSGSTNPPGCSCPEPVLKSCPGTCTFFHYWLSAGGQTFSVWSTIWCDSANAQTSNCGCDCFDWSSDNAIDCSTSGAKPNTPPANTPNTYPCTNPNTGASTVCVDHPITCWGYEEFLPCESDSSGSSSGTWTQTSDCDCENCTCAEPAPISPIPGTSQDEQVSTPCCGEGTSGTGTIDCDCDVPSTNDYEDGETETTPCYGGPCDTSNSACCAPGECEYIWDAYSNTWDLDSGCNGMCEYDDFSGTLSDSSQCDMLICGCPDPEPAPSCPGVCKYRWNHNMNLWRNAGGSCDCDFAMHGWRYSLCFAPGMRPTTDLANTPGAYSQYGLWFVDVDVTCTGYEEFLPCEGGEDTCTGACPDPDVDCECVEPTYAGTTDQESCQGTCMPDPTTAALSNRSFGLSNKIPRIRNSREEIRNSSALKVTRKGVSKVYLNVKAIKRKRRTMARKVASRRQRMR